MGIFVKKEIKSLIVSILILSFIFGFDDKRSVFELRYWIGNFLWIIVGVMTALILKEFAMKLAAKKYGCTTEFGIWQIKRIWFSKGAEFKKFGIPLGILLGLYLSLISLGKIYFAAISLTTVEGNRTKRVGKQFTRLTEFEESFILFTGAMTCLILALIFNLLTPYFNFGIFVTINKWLALLAFLPVPNLDGFRIFIGSRSLYVFGLIATIICFILMGYLSPLLSFIFGMIFSLIVTLIYFFLIEYD